MKIVGRRIVDYESKKKPGTRVKGISLQCTSPRANVEGLAVEEIFVSEKMEIHAELAKVPLQTEIMVSYNRWGNIDSLSIVK